MKKPFLTGFTGLKSDFVFCSALPNLFFNPVHPVNLVRLFLFLFSSHVHPGGMLRVIHGQRFVIILP